MYFFGNQRRRINCLLATEVLIITSLTRRLVLVDLVINRCRVRVRVRVRTCQTVTHVWPWCQRSGAEAANAHGSRGQAEAPCGNGARSTSRLRTWPRPAAGAAPPSTAHAGAQRSHPEGCAGRRSGRVRFRCARRGEQRQQQAHRGRQQQQAMQQQQQPQQQQQLCTSCADPGGQWQCECRSLRLVSGDCDSAQWSRTGQYSRGLSPFPSLPYVPRFP